VNWTLAPVVDIDYNFRNPITNVKTFGNDIETIKKWDLDIVKQQKKKEWQFLSNIFRVMEEMREINIFLQVSMTASK
jgi:hypothetical protein